MLELGCCSSYAVSSLIFIVKSGLCRPPTRWNIFLTCSSVLDRSLVVLRCSPFPSRRTAFALHHECTAWTSPWAKDLHHVARVLRPILGAVAADLTENISSSYGVFSTRNQRYCPGEVPSTDQHETTTIAEVDCHTGGQSTFPGHSRAFRKMKFKTNCPLLHSLASLLRWNSCFIVEVEAVAQYFLASLAKTVI